MGRIIRDVLHFRNDISPFLTHLTREHDNFSAKDSLISIIQNMTIKQNVNPKAEISPLCYNVDFSKVPLDSEKHKLAFYGISFTETPLNEIHSLLDIDSRQIELSKYGLVFLKKGLSLKHVSPVFYLNNSNSELDDVADALGDIIEKEDMDESLFKILPLISVTGNPIKSRYRDGRRSHNIDFSWEREWRLPYYYGDFNIEPEDLFVGLCDDDDIEDFEDLAKAQFGTDIPFIDPQRNAKWYASKLVKRRGELNIGYSVV